MYRILGGTYKWIVFPRQSLLWQESFSSFLGECWHHTYLRSSLSFKFQPQPTGKTGFVCLFTTTSIAHVLYTIVHSAIYGRALVYTLGARWGEKMTWKKVKNWTEKEDDFSEKFFNFASKWPEKRCDIGRKCYRKNRSEFRRIWCEIRRNPWQDPWITNLWHSSINK